VVGAAVVGAFVGGAATAGASYWNGRFERRHRACATLFVDLLPELLGTKPIARKRSQRDVMDDIRRTAVLGGTRCSRHAEVLYRTFKAQHHEIPSNPYEVSLVKPSFMDHFRRSEPLSGSIEEAVATLDKWLVQRLT
jgi:hypothetical protein